MQGGPIAGIQIGAYIWDGAYRVRNGSVLLVGVGSISVGANDEPTVTMAGVGGLTATATFPPNYGRPVTHWARREPDDVIQGG